MGCHAIEGVSAVMDHFDQSPRVRLKAENLRGPDDIEGCDLVRCRYPRSLYLDAGDTIWRRSSVRLCVYGLISSESKSVGLSPRRSRSLRALCFVLPPQGGIHIIQAPRQMQGASNAGVAAFLFLLPSFKVRANRQVWD